MVQNSGTPPRAHHLRPLNPPRLLQVFAERDEPVALIEEGRQSRVISIDDTWQIDDEWWRSPVQRRYYRVLLESGAIRVIYRDSVAGCWYAQSY